MRLERLKVKVFLDGADPGLIAAYADDPLVKGFTTNPSLMRKAGITRYEEFARQVLALTNKPVSFEVLSDDFPEMERQARIIAGWGENVFVKIPIINSRGEPSHQLIRTLSMDVQLNITAVMSVYQIVTAIDCLAPERRAFVSVFAGRIADAGQDPETFIKYAVFYAREKPFINVLWASTRELFNIYQAERAGSHVITVSAELLAKRHLIGKHLAEYSRETVKQFYDDAAGYKL